MIKTYIIGMLLLFNLPLVQAQNLDRQKTITVTGSADISVPPDEFVLEITLREHGSKFGEKSLNKIESKLKRMLEKHDIDTDKLIFSNQSNYWYYWWCNRHRSHGEKSFKIKLSEKTDLLALVQDLNFKGVADLRVADSTNKNLHELRKEVKKEAIKAAKEKATYLLSAIEEQIGGVISVEEIPAVNQYHWRNNQNLLTNFRVANKPTVEGQENLPQIKLRYEVKTVFEILEK